MKSLLLHSMALLGDALRRTPIARWQWLGRLHANLAVRLGRTESVMVGPFRVFIDPRDRVIAKKLILYGGYEQREIDLLCSLVQPGDCVLDIGANIGLYSLALSRAVGSTGRVIAFEPDPDNAVLLRKNLDANGCGNVTVIEDALGDESKDVNLYESDDNRGALSTSDVLGVGEEHAIRVRMRRGDAVLAQLGVQPRLAKIDVEGAEPLVIAGLGAQLPQVLMFEFVPQLLRAAGRNPADFLHELQSVGYSLAAVDPETGRVRDLTPAELAAGAVTEAADRNILARRYAG
ncbi:MAG TPA: FkbM family methyltransferase [Steroidobacteraceae bacterium]